jgi:hypothetical protein
MGVENNPAANPENDPNCLLRDWPSPEPVGEGWLYDAKTDEFWPDPESLIPEHYRGRDPDDPDFKFRSA